MNLEHALNRFGRDNVARIEFDETGQVTAVDLVDHSQVLLSNQDAPIGVGTTPRASAYPWPTTSGTPQILSWEQAKAESQAILHQAEPPEPEEPENSSPSSSTTEDLIELWRQRVEQQINGELMKLRADLDHTGDDLWGNLIYLTDSRIRNHLSLVWDGLLSSTAPEE